jgi:hypothetical protein
LLRTLDAALGRNYRAFAQVGLAELANPVDSASVHLRRRALNAVMEKSVDFVVCDVLTLDPVVVIEVDDRSIFCPNAGTEAPSSTRSSRRSACRSCA